MTCVMHEHEVSQSEEPDAEPGLTEIDVVHAVHDKLELPDGFQAEIIEGQLVIVATPNVKHAQIIRKIDRALTSAIPETYECFQVISTQEPEGDRYVPDLGVWPVEIVEEKSEAWLMDTSDLLLAVEVTSPRHEDDDYAKASGYARAEVPIYLLVDRKRNRCVLHTDPEAGKYRTVQSTDFGKTIVIPLETPVELGTDW